MITTNPEFFITDALELIEDDQANNTIMVGEDSGDDDKQDASMLDRKDQEFVESYDVPEFLWDIEKVTDWSKRIASYNAEQREFYNTMVPKLNELKNIMSSSDGWNLLVDMKQDELKIEIKKSVRGFTICRGQGTINWPALDIWRAMCYKPFKQEWDINNE